MGAAAQKASVYSVNNSPRRAGNGIVQLTHNTEETPLLAHTAKRLKMEPNTSNLDSSSIIGIKAQLKQVTRKITRTKTAAAPKRARITTALMPNAQNSDKQFKISIDQAKNRLTFENVYLLKNQMQSANKA